MAKFSKELVVKKVGNMLWEVYTEFDYQVGGEKSKDFIRIPKGFTTDFASVPRLFWQILPPDGQYTGAALVHDYLYWLQLRTRKESDGIFLEAMKALGVPLVERLIMYQAVRSFGWMPWNNQARRLKGG